MPENTESGFDWTRIIKPAATAASLAPALWLKGQRKEDWLRGAGGFWSGVTRAEERRKQNEQRDALAEYYKERAKSLESERKAEEARAKVTAYRANRPSGVGKIGAPSMIGQTQIGGDVTLSPERLNWIRSQMGGGARPAPPTGQRLKPSPPAAAGEMRPELFETGTPMTGQEKGQFLGAVGTTAGGMVRPDLFGKPPTAKPEKPNMTYGQAINQSEQDFRARYDPVGVGAWSRSAELGDSPEKRTAAREDWIKKRAGEYMWGDVPGTGEKPQLLKPGGSQDKEYDVAQKLKNRLQNLGLGSDSIDWATLKADNPDLNIEKIKSYLEQ